MSMNVNGMYRYAKSDDLKTAGRPLDEAEKAKEVKKESDDAKTSNRTLDRQDEYVKGGEEDKKLNGLYRLGTDENGRRKIVYDDPKKSAGADKAVEKGQPKADPDRPENSEEKCIGNTDQVEREIRKLKERKEQLEQQIQSARSDEEKVRELEKKLAQVENELRQKDNDTYRRQNASFTDAEI